METVSVIIATCNRRTLLAQCLESIRAGYPPFEVIVVDDGSADKTAEWLNAEAARWPLLRVLRQENRGQAAARNAGARQAAGSVFAFTDDDCRVRPGWVNSIVKEFNEKAILGSEGPVIGFPEDGIISPFSHSIHNPKGPGYLTCNLAIRRAVFLKLGGFDERFRMHEDTDLCLRVLRDGGISFNPEMIVEHPPRRYRLFHGITQAPEYAKRYVQAEYLLFLRHPAQYKLVRYHASFQQTFNALALKYVWLFSRMPFSRIRTFPLDFCRLVLLNLSRQIFILLWYGKTRIIPSFTVDSNGKSKGHPRG